MNIYQQNQTKTDDQAEMYIASHKQQLNRICVSKTWRCILKT